MQNRLQGAYNDAWTDAISVRRWVKQFTDVNTNIAGQPPSGRPLTVAGPKKTRLGHQREWMCNSQGFGRRDCSRISVRSRSAGRLGSSLAKGQETSSGTQKQIPHKRWDSTKLMATIFCTASCKVTTAGSDNLSGIKTSMEWQGTAAANKVPSPQGHGNCLLRCWRIQIGRGFATKRRHQCR
jgi:hypothetical protein